MKSHPAWIRDSSGMLTDLKDFSIVLGGPLFQLLRRIRLIDDALHLLRQRVVVIALTAWLPLLLLAALDGKLLHGGVAVPFVRDVEVHVRFLVALPLLVIAELVAHLRMRPMLNEFVQRKLVPDEDLVRFDRAMTTAFRWRNSVVAEVLLIAFVYGVGILVIWRNFVALNAATWYSRPSPGGPRLSLAGMWYGFVSLPIFQFLLVRWYFRLFIWARFLWQVSRIRLKLVPTHPDRAGGLSFLSDSIYGFAVLAVAHGALVAGYIANRIFFIGARLTSFKGEIGVTVAFVMFAVFGPLLVFARQLAEIKRKGLNEYGALASRYVREFDARWLRGGAKPGEVFCGSADVQSLADIGNSYEVVRTMRPVPFTREAILLLAASTLVPIAPLVLTLMPLEDLLKKLMSTLF